MSSMSGSSSVPTETIVFSDVEEDNDYDIIRPLKKARTRELSEIWKVFTADVNPHLVKSSICKHCHKSYNHHKQSEQALIHLKKCDAFKVWLLFILS